MIGANDFCVDVCFRRSPMKAVDNHVLELQTALRTLRDNLPRTLVNVVPGPSAYNQWFFNAIVSLLNCKTYTVSHNIFKRWLALTPRKISRVRIVNWRLRTLSKEWGWAVVNRISYNYCYRLQMLKRSKVTATSHPYAKFCTWWTALVSWAKLIDTCGRWWKT